MKIEDLVAMKENGIVYDFEDLKEFEYEKWFILYFGTNVKGRFEVDLERFKRSQYNNGRKLAYKYCFDADRCSLALEIYQALWQEQLDFEVMTCADKKNRILRTKNNLKFSGETMNSYNTTFCSKTRGRWANNKYFIEGEKVEKYYSLTHSIGNFIPVPQITGYSFNSSRGGGKVACYLRDYWDLTLLAIKNWYGNKDLNKQIINEWLDGNAKWLDEMFGCWRNFINQNYLNSFVDGNYEVKLFWDGHSFENPRPKNKEEVEVFLYRVQTCIKERGKLMISKLEKEFL